MPQFFRLSRKKVLIIITFIVLSFAGFNLLSPKKQTALQFAEVKRQDIKAVVSSSGTLAGKDSASLKFKSAGRLAYINVKQGSKVQKGQVIAGLDTQQMAIDLQQAQNTLREKQAIVDKTLDDVKDHSKDETFTQRQTRTSAEVARDNAYDAVKEAQRAFQDVVLYSPISGTITQVSILPGQNASTSDVIAQVVDNSEYYFDTEVDEADISKILKDMPAEVTLDAYENQVFTGMVDQITPQTKITSQGATVIPVKIALHGPNFTFVNGLSGQASIITSSSPHTLVIPREALREDNTVILQRRGKLEEVKVTTGIQSDTDIEIKSGLSEKEQVLLNPPSPGARLNQNRNPLQTAIFRLFGGRNGGAFRR